MLEHLISLLLFHPDSGFFGSWVTYVILCLGFSSLFRRLNFPDRKRVFLVASYLFGTICIVSLIAALSTRPWEERGMFSGLWPLFLAIFFLIGSSAAIFIGLLGSSITLSIINFKSINRQQSIFFLALPVFFFCFVGVSIYFRVLSNSQNPEDIKKAYYSSWRILDRKVITNSQMNPNAPMEIFEDSTDRSIILGSPKFSKKFEAIYQATIQESRVNLYEFKSAISKISQIESKESTEILMKIASSPEPENPTTTETKSFLAIQALIKIHKLEAVPFLRSIVESNVDNPYAESAVVYGLLQLGATGELQNLIRRHPELKKICSMFLNDPWNHRLKVNWNPEARVEMSNKFTSICK